MLDFFERAYFAELDRKTKLQTALAFPFSVMVVGVTLMAFAAQNWKFEGCDGIIPIIMFFVSIPVFLLFTINTIQFSLGKHYKYIWTLDEMVDHREVLEKFSLEYPDTPSAKITFNKQLERDIALCTTHNSKMNDIRSGNLYHAHACALVFVLLAFAIATFVLLSNLIGKFYV